MAKLEFEEVTMKYKLGKGDIQGIVYKAKAPGGWVLLYKEVITFKKGEAAGSLTLLNLN